MPISKISDGPCPEIQGAISTCPVRRLDRPVPLAFLNIQKNGDGVGGIKSLQPQASGHPTVPHAEKKSPFAKYSNQQMTEAPARGAFLLLVLGGYMLATRGKTLYQWLHGGYMSQE